MLHSWTLESNQEVLISKSVNLQIVKTPFGNSAQDPVTKCS